MLTKIEKLGDRLLSLVVPHANASAQCGCTWVGVCDRTRDTWRCCPAYPGTAPCWYQCAYSDPCS
jgi:hypothetical protein